MQADSIEMTAQSYAAVFECVERSNIYDKYDLLNNYRKEMSLKVKNYVYLISYGDKMILFDVFLTYIYIFMIAGIRT